ncbi:LysM peptidoglycan-binding domain-containing protein [Weissella confusa]|uniref:LysM peptidoglycan-binding domain-containing protein n=1 Tax=Weissella confusa TaxID=1583 RepID=UPI0005E88EE6|nr:LysM domain-containing protein [Weissella confusa]COI26695.1 LysM domain protein [Streptococcus pneumoniae]MBJ7619756.1 LysM peptidoglycan-binding domain-containing protein [Weissella confusa]MBJ7667091.1 LysM peptidoglycan-binding domain-containing protein [Weissella confusa]MCT0009948.1 LysM peptidoglycan-binding domain-containing protein [Weissella confusa]MCT0022598.1 LysM peptidoglycan-binding domain-containing protein [Weissella confusa]
MNKMKETALTVAGLASVLVAGQQVVHAASTYTVQNGDTLSELADKFNMTVEDLVKTNKISDANMIFTDQQIQVPTSAEVNQATLDSAAASSANSAAATAASAAASEAASSAAAASSVAASEAAASESAASSAAASSAAASKAAASSAAASAQQATTVTVSTAAGSGSVYDQFIAAGGTAALWNAIVLPESGGNPNAVSPNGYRGLGQTKQAWGTGSVVQQTAGLVNYAVSRYGSIDGAIQFRLANGWW